MDEDIKELVKIIPKPKSITWEEITDLLHQSFKERADQGIDYLAVDQDVETTIKRNKGGTCFIALFKNMLVGTATLHIKQGKKWYEGKKYGYFSQLAVHPKYKRMGIASLLFEERLIVCRKFGVDAIVLHASANAKSIIAFHEKRGAQKVSFMSGRNNNYYSIYFRHPVNSKKINPLYCLIRYHCDRIKVLITRKENGELTWIGSLGRKLIYKS